MGSGRPAAARWRAAAAAASAGEREHERAGGAVVNSTLDEQPDLPRLPVVLTSWHRLCRIAFVKKRKMFKRMSKKKKKVQFHRVFVSHQHTCLTAQSLRKKT